MQFVHPITLLAAGALMASACAVAAPPDHADHGKHTLWVKVPIATATLKAADGSTKGQAWLAEDEGRWILKVAVQGLPAGVHGAHLHTVGKCDAPDFASAGGHLNPAAKQHGNDNPQGAHLGDMPNVTVGADGKGNFVTTLMGSAAELGATLFDADGTAVVVHAGPDDYRTDPSGNSGGRIACGVLTRAG